MITFLSVLLNLALPNLTTGRSCNEFEGRSAASRRCRARRADAPGHGRGRPPQCRQGSVIEFDDKRGIDVGRNADPAIAWRERCVHCYRPACQQCQTRFSLDMPSTLPGFRYTHARISRPPAGEACQKDPTATKSSTSKTRYSPTHRCGPLPNVLCGTWPRSKSISSGRSYSRSSIPDSATGTITMSRA